MPKLLAGPEGPDSQRGLGNDLANSSLVTQPELRGVDEDALDMVWNASLELQANQTTQRKGKALRVNDLKIIDCGDFALGIKSERPIYEAFFVNPQTGQKLNNKTGFDRVSKGIEGEIIAGRGSSNYLVNTQTGDEKLLGKNRYS